MTNEARGPQPARSDRRPTAPRFHRPSTGGARGALLLAGLLLLAAGPATAFDPEAWPGDATLGPGAVFDSIETAVVDALAHAHHRPGPKRHGRLRLGTIHRVEGGYSYTEPIESAQTIWSRSLPVIRFGLRDVDVATYVIHPKSGNNRVDRLGEQPNDSERRVVDELDPRGRPIYLLTPKRRIIRYSGLAGADGGRLVELLAPLPPAASDGDRRIAAN